MDIATADAYFETRLHSEAWEQASTSDKAKALATAEREIGTLQLHELTPGAVRNEAISRGRSRRRRELRERRQAAGRVELFEPRADDLIDARSAQAALERLDADQRELVVLRIWADMTLDQIARTTGLSVATVFRRYRAALAAIRKEMQPCTKTTT